MEEKKSPLKSKTIQVNTVAILLSYGLSQANIQIPGEVQIAFLGLVNYVLRMITKDAIGFN